MKPTFSVNFQSKNRQQGMHLLSMCVDVLDQLVAANMAAAMLVDGQFIATNSDLVMSLYERCVNIAKTYGLDFTFNLSPVENEPEYGERVVINKKWFISEQRAKDLQSKEEKHVDFSKQYQLEMALEEQIQSNDEFTFASEKDLMEHDKACEQYEDKIYKDNEQEYNLYMGHTHLDNSEVITDSKLKNRSVEHVQFNEHSQMQLDLLMEDQYFNPFEDPDETPVLQPSFGAIPQSGVRVSDSNSVNVNKWAPSDAYDYSDYDYSQEFKYPEVEEDFEHNQQGLDIDYTKGFDLDEDLDFNKEVIINTGEIAKKLGQTFDKVCEQHEEIPYDPLDEQLYYWYTSGCSDEGQY